MENASKALLIAGSVLVVILLIAIGVRVLNSTQGTTEATESTMKNTEIEMFNNQFIQYSGKNISAAEAYTLANKVVVSNAQNKEHFVTLKIDGDIKRGQTGNKTVNFDHSKTYHPGFYFDDNGYIREINIKTNK